MTIARKRKPTVPCELCRRFKPTRKEGLWRCGRTSLRTTPEDGCTRGEYKEEGGEADARAERNRA